MTPVAGGSMRRLRKVSGWDYRLRLDLKMKVYPIDFPQLLLRQKALGVKIL